MGTPGPILPTVQRDPFSFIGHPRYVGIDRNDPHPMTRLLFLLFCALALLGCDAHSASEDDPSEGTGQILIGGYAVDQLEGDPFDLRAARIEGTLLLLDVAYSGGCEEHAFSGYTPDVNIAIYPPQLSVFVVHDGMGDMCEAYITQTVSLDLRSLIDAYGDLFQLTVVPVDSPSGIIILQSGT
jgi:hypothetical protein